MNHDPIDNHPMASGEDAQYAITEAITALKERSSRV